MIDIMICVLIYMMIYMLISYLLSYLISTFIFNVYYDTNNDVIETDTILDLSGATLTAADFECEF